MYKFAQKFVTLSFFTWVLRLIQIHACQSHNYVAKIEFFCEKFIKHAFFRTGGGGKRRCTERGVEYFGAELNIRNNGPRNKVSYYITLLEILPQLIVEIMEILSICL